MSWYPPPQPPRKDFSRAFIWGMGITLGVWAVSILAGTVSLILWGSLVAAMFAGGGSY